MDHIKLKCTENKSADVESGYYDNSGKLVHLATPNLIWTEYGSFASLALLRDIACNKEFAGIGVQVNSVDGAINVTKVVEDAPAGRAGVKPGDVISHIDDESIQGWSVDKVVEHFRGQAGTEVRFRILRKGQEKPMEFSVSREMIRVQSAHDQTKQ